MNRFRLAAWALVALAPRAATAAVQDRVPRVRHRLVDGADHRVHRERPGAVVDEVLAAD